MNISPISFGTRVKAPKLSEVIEAMTGMSQKVEKPISYERPASAEFCKIKKTSVIKEFFQKLFGKKR